MITAKVDITKEHHAKNICRPAFRSSPRGRRSQERVGHLSKAFRHVCVTCLCFIPFKSSRELTSRSPLHFTATFSQHSLSTVVACCHSTRRSELLRKKHDIQDHRSERCQPKEKRDLLNDHCKGGYHQGAPCKEHLQTSLQIISQASSPSQGLFSSKKEDHKQLLSVMLVGISRITNKNRYYQQGGE